MNATYSRLPEDTLEMVATFSGCPAMTHRVWVHRGVRAACRIGPEAKNG